ncbi:hypothetical protein MPER_02156, partial [Moniliophthora perniciosa FA553]
MSQPTSQGPNAQGEDYQFAGPLLVSKLQEAGIHPNDIKKLSDAGLNTGESVAFTPRNRFYEKGFFHQKEKKIWPKGKGPKKILPPWGVPQSRNKIFLAKKTGNF